VLLYIFSLVISSDRRYRIPKKVRFLDEVKAVRKEAARLKANGVDILLALGHSGYERDQMIADGVPDVDVVVGGHSHSLLYSGERG